MNAHKVRNLWTASIGFKRAVPLESSIDYLRLKFRAIVSLYAIPCDVVSLSESIRIVVSNDT